ASWQPGVIALATPLEGIGGPALALNLSLATDEPLAAVEQRHAPALLALKARILHELAVGIED
ncbi:hypothetical protein LDP44_30140, partial [Pseudomonas aeruginosa]|nr:hypothetical protein [Pseudomonas aeruginosa]